MFVRQNGMPSRSVGVTCNLGTKSACYICHFVECECLVGHMLGIFWLLHPQILMTVFMWV